MHTKKSVMNFIFIYLITFVSIAMSRNDSKNDPRSSSDLTLWMDEKQVKMLSGVEVEIFAIENGNVSSYILDPNFEKYLPVIPSEVNSVNFTWKAGNKKYIYEFNLTSFDKSVMEAPVISIKSRGRIPKHPKEFSVFLPCIGNRSGIAKFQIELGIKTRKGVVLNDTPLKLKLKKECSVTKRSPDPECDKKCANQGWCNEEKICQCKEGYMGQYCKTALCYPQCINGGVCTSPGVCSCPPGFQGANCEGGICSKKCLNGGKCMQNDTCTCTKGYYGPRCEFSRCIIPCLNYGRCKGVNKCRCGRGFRGDHCEIGKPKTARAACSSFCRHGSCAPDGEEGCVCDEGWHGPFCQYAITM